MSILNFTGFETGNAQEAVATGGTPAFGTSVVKNGTYSLELTPGDDIAYYVNVANPTTTPEYVSFGFYWRTNDATPTTDGSVARFKNASSVAGTLRLMTNGKLRVGDSTSTYSSDSTTTFQDNTWYRLELRIYEHATNGHIYLYADGSLECSLTSADTGNEIDRIELRNSTTGLSTFYYDDLYLCGTTTVDPGTGDLFYTNDSLDWDVPGYYQPVTGGVSQGTTPATGSLANTGENPLNESNAAEWDGSTDDADWAADGTRAGPTSDIDGTVVAAKWWYRADRDGGGGTNHYLQYGHYDTSTWNHTEVLTTIDTSPTDYYKFSTSATYMPTTTSDSHAWGIRVDGAQDLWIYEVGGWILQTTSSGTAYQRSVSDSVGITDTISRVIGRYKTISDSVGITDTVSNARSLYKTIADAVGVTDTVVRSAGIYKTLSDTVGITDTLSTALIIYASILDTVGITDTLTTSILRAVTLQNTVGVTDTLSTVRNIVKTIADDIGITDTLTTARDIVISFADNVGITDTVARIIKLIVSLADSVGITDTIANTRALSRTKSESVGITDTLSTARDIVKSISDSVGITDALTTARDIFISIAESVGITDVIDAVKGAAAKYATITDTVGITDTVSTVRELKVAFADALGVTDEIFTARDIKTLFAEAVGITDTVTGYRKIFVALADTVGITDTVATVVQFVAQKILKTIISTLGIIAVTTSEEE